MGPAARARVAATGTGGTAVEMVRVLATACRQGDPIAREDGVRARIFAGDPQRSPVFKITSTSLRAETTGGGFVFRFRYIAEGTLSANGRNHVVHGEGTRAAYAYNERALHEAVQLGIVDAARKVKAILVAGASAEP